MALSLTVSLDVAMGMAADFRVMEPTMVLL